MTALLLAATAVLIALNAFYVAAEYALVRARKSRLESLKEDGAKMLLVEDFYNKSVAALVAQKAGARMLDLPSDVGATPQIKDWFSLVETVLKQLSQAV